MKFQINILIASLILACVKSSWKSSQEVICWSFKNNKLFFFYIWSHQTEITLEYFRINRVFALMSDIHENLLQRGVAGKLDIINFKRGYPGRKRLFTGKFGCKINSTEMKFITLIPNLTALWVVDKLSRRTFRELKLGKRH